MNSRALGVVALVASCLAFCGGCTGHVVRTITIESEPPGAIVWLNDNEVGRTPVTAEFTWYGVYRVRLEKEGYETFTSYERVAAPWYELVGLDLAFETVVPGTRRDEHRFGPYTLEKAVPSNPTALLERAKEFRKEAREGLTGE
jgi:hypothetical protein